MRIKVNKPHLTYSLYTEPSESNYKKYYSELNNKYKEINLFTGTCVNIHFRLLDIVRSTAFISLDIA